VRVTAILVTGLSLWLPSAARAQRLEAGGFVTYPFLERIGSSDHGVGTSTLAPGGRAAWHLVRFVLSRSLRPHRADASPGCSRKRCVRDGGTTNRH
jgi:hypothetical protein